MWRAILLACAALCAGELSAPGERGPLRIVSDEEPSYTDVIVKRINDTLSLWCGNGHNEAVVWSLPPAAYARLNGSRGPAWERSPRLHLAALRPADAGAYVCAAPPHSVGKYVVVQPPAAAGCARGGFSCGVHCVLPRYVCDGRRDCPRGEDESEATCGTPQPCSGKLKCDDGRCISDAWCCDPALERDCVRPSCCDRLRPEPADTVGWPAPERTADDAGFVQTGIYTVTACALIFMIAVVLLVSAICKMHMKREALHSYARAERARQHYALPCPYPPRYEPPRPPADAAPDPSQQQPASPSEPLEPSAEEPPSPAPARPTNFGLGRLTDAIFSSRYRAVPTRCCDADPPGPPRSAASSPVCLADYAGPAFCDLSGGEYYFASADTGRYGRDLNCEGFMSERDRRRRASAVERLLDRISFNTYDQGCDERSLTLQLGRFQLSLPRFARTRRERSGRRPDTPNVAELNIEELDFVRLNSSETYTLNGRTIRLLGAEFEEYAPAAPTFVGRVVAPPPYSEAVAVAPSKVFGPPPAYLSRENLTDANRNLDPETNLTLDADTNLRPDTDTNRMSVASASSDASDGPPADCNGNTEVLGVCTAADTGAGGAEPPPSYEELARALDNCDRLDANANSTE